MARGHGGRGALTRGRVPGHHELVPRHRPRPRRARRDRRPPRHRDRESQKGDLTRTHGKAAMEAFLQAENGGADVGALDTRDHDMAAGAIRAIREVGPVEEQRPLQAQEGVKRDEPRRVEGERREGLGAPPPAPLGRDPCQPIEPALDGREDRRQPGALARMDARHVAGQDPSAAHRHGGGKDVPDNVGPGVPLEAVGPRQDQDEVDEDEGGPAGAEEEVGHGGQPRPSRRMARPKAAKPPKSRARTSRSVMRRLRPRRRIGDGGPRRKRAMRNRAEACKEGVRDCGPPHRASLRPAKPRRPIRCPTTRCP